jgi:tetratricopeptide (TPR) repeat protein
LVYLQQILAGDPRHRVAFGESERLLTQLERWHELIDLLDRLAEVEAAEGNTAGELACRVKIASLWGEKLGAEENALEALESVLAKNPQHCPSLLAVARIHMAAERWEEASAALEKAATVATTPEDKADFFYRQARIKQATGAGLDVVIPLFQSSLSHEPTYGPALAALEEIGRQHQQPALLASVLAVRLDQQTDVAKQKSLLAELTKLLVGPLNAPHEALPLLDRLRALAPDDLQVQESQASALIAAGRVDEGEFAMGQLIEGLTKARRMKEVARLQCVLGGFAASRGDLGLAQQRYASAYQIDPTQAVVLGALARLSLRQQDAEGSRRYLRTLLLQSYDEKAAGITKPEVYLELGRLHAAAGENAKARNMFERGLEIEPRNEALKQALSQTPR